MSWEEWNSMAIDKVYVLGAGAIGSVYGAFLSKNADVTLVGNKAHIEAIRVRGLRLVGEVRKCFLPKADLRIGEIPPRTLILLTTKAHDSASAVKQIASMLRDDTVIIILQNGIGNERVVEEIATGIEVLRGLTTMAAELEEPGKVRVWKGSTILAKGDAAEDVAALFNECGLETRVSEKINTEIWGKLALNCVINPLTALFRVRNVDITSESLKWVRHEIVRECFAVAKAERADPEFGSADIDSKIRGYTNFSSMCQDVMKGKKTEIEFLNGKVVKLAQKHGISTPVNQTMTCLTKFLEERTSGVPRKD